MGDLFYKSLPSQRDLGKKIKEREPNESLQRVGTVLNYNALQDMVVGLILMEKLLLLLHWRRGFFCVWALGQALSLRVRLRGRTKKKEDRRREDRVFKMLLNDFKCFSTTKKKRKSSLNMLETDTRRKETPDYDPATTESLNKRPIFLIFSRFVSFVTCSGSLAEPENQGPAPPAVHKFKPGLDTTDGD